MSGSSAPEPPRIVSLVPSITELVCALGLAGHLVGRTGFCIHPADAVLRVPKVGGTKTVNLAKIRRLEPTHVIVNVDENRKETADALRAFVPNVIVTHPLGPEDNPALYRQLGSAFGREQEAEALCSAFEQGFAEARQRIHPEKKVLYLIWKDPWMTVSRDTYVSRILACFGLQTVPAESPKRYPEVPDLAACGADLVLLSSEPYRFRDPHRAEVEALTGRPARLIDGEMTSWYGPRAIEGLRYLSRFVGDLP